MERIGRPQRPPLKKLDGPRQDPVRDVDHARVFDVLEECLLAQDDKLRRPTRGLSTSATPTLEFGINWPGELSAAGTSQWQ